MIAKKVLLWSLLSLFILGCNLIAKSPAAKQAPVPLVTPSMPNRTIGRVHNFPWRERWRIPLWLDANSNYLSNMRNFIALDGGIVFVDNPLQDNPVGGLLMPLKSQSAKYSLPVWGSSFDLDRNYSLK